MLAKVGFFALDLVQATKYSSVTSKNLSCCPTC